MTADLLFPNSDLTFGKMLANIANRGSLYAIIVTPINKEMSSITVNILYGVPSEHRNMPLDDGIELIYRNYEQLRQGEKGDITGDNDESPYTSVALASVKHSDSIQHLVNLLAENRSLTVLQIDCLLKYLQERRELQYKFELGDSNVGTNADNLSAIGNETKSGGGGGISSTSAMETSSIEKMQTDTVEIPQKENAEEELQRKLLEIMHKPTISNLNTEPTSLRTSADKNSTKSTASIDIQEPKLLSDPNVKNVLDSLFDF